MNIEERDATLSLLIFSIKGFQGKSWCMLDRYVAFILFSFNIMLILYFLNKFIKLFI